MLLKYETESADDFVIEYNVDFSIVYSMWFLLLTGYHCSVANVTDPALYPCPPGYYCPQGTTDPREYPCSGTSGYSSVDVR